MKRALIAALALIVLGPAADAAPPALPAFAHVIVVVFENKEQSSVIPARAAPTFTSLARRYAQITHDYGVTHPSLPNYIALVSGSTQGITSNCTSCIVSALNLADTLEAVGKTWKLYAEGLPHPGFTGGVAGRYAKKHAPFLYFRDVVTAPARLNRVVPFSQLARDLHASTLPDFALVVPDLCHSMHDCSVAVGDAWLRRMIGPLLTLPRTAVFIVFDEGASNARGGGNIPAVAAGTAVRRHARFNGVTNHYGLLRTIEAAWGLPLLGRSATAMPITGIWR